MKKKVLSICIALFFIVGTNQAQIRIIDVDPATDQITFENKGGSAENVGNKILCARFDYTFGTIANDAILISGNLVLDPGATVTVEWTDFLDNGSSDLGLYTNTSFTNPGSMIDFMQYGAGGIGREGIAVMAGLWEAGTFVENPGPFSFTGGGLDTGVDFWENGSVGIYSLQDLNELIQIQGNQVTDQIIISHDIDKTERIEISIVSLAGQMMKRENIFTTQKEIRMDVQNFTSGMYLVRFRVEDSMLVRKIIKRS